MSGKAVDYCLVALKFVLNRFVTSKSIKKRFTGLYADDNILYFNKNSGNAVFYCNGMGILNKDLNNIDLDDTNYGEDYPENIIHYRPLALHIKS